MRLVAHCVPEVVGVYQGLGGGEWGDTSGLIEGRVSGAFLQEVSPVKIRGNLGKRFPHILRVGQRRRVRQETS